VLSHTTKKQLALAVAGNCSFGKKVLQVESLGVHYIDDLDMAGGESVAFVSLVPYGSRHRTEAGPNHAIEQLLKV
jgi:hypothetical protein